MKATFALLALALLGCGGERKLEGGKAAEKGAEDPVVVQAEAQIRRAAQPEWAQLRTIVEALGTDEGCRKLHGTHPGLARQYPAPEAFLGHVRAHRQGLEVLPPQLNPQLAPRFELKREVPGTTRIRYAWASGVVLDLELDGLLIKGLALSGPAHR